MPAEEELSGCENNPRKSNLALHAVDAWRNSGCFPLRYYLRRPSFSISALYRFTSLFFR